MPDHPTAQARIDSALRIAQDRRAYAQLIRDGKPRPNNDDDGEAVRCEVDAEVIEGLCATLSEALATRDLLTDENARLQKEVATLRFLQQGGQAATASARQVSTVSWEIPRDTWDQLNRLIPRGA